MQHRRTLAGWSGEVGPLLDWLRERITPQTLRTITGGLEEHLAVLKDIYETGLVPHPLRFHPAEVLELTGWQKGPSTDHLARAYCCALLCLDRAGPETRRDDQTATLAVLVESCIKLGPEALAALVRFLAALIEGTPRDTNADFVFLHLALLLAAIAQDAADPRLPALGEYLLALEQRWRAEWSAPDEQWLLGLTRFDQRHKLWRALAARLLTPTTAAPLPQIAALLQKPQRPSSERRQRAR